MTPITTAATAIVARVGNQSANVLIAVRPSPDPPNYKGFYVAKYISLRYKLHYLRFGQLG